MTKMTGGELLVETLRDHGVRHIFSIIGGQMCSVYDAISYRADMELVTLRNEAAAPMMAAGCTAVTGLPSVSMCTVGAGVVYEVAGLMAAWYGYLPVISIAPQVQSWKMKPHQENLQGLNQDGIFEPVTKWNAIVYHWKRIPELTNRALREALANAPGPVHLDIPVDVLFKTGKLDDKKRKKIMPPAAHTRFAGSLPGPKDHIEKAGEAFSRNEKPLVVVGQGMGRPGRYPALREMLNKLGAPVLLSDTSSGIMNGKDEYHAGALGLFTESDRGLQALQEADLIMIIGLDDQVKEALDKFNYEQKTLVQVEVDPSALLTGERDHIGVNADPVSFLSALTKTIEVDSNKWSAWLERMQQTGASLSKELAVTMPGYASIFKGVAPSLSGNDIVVVDGGEPGRAANAFLQDANYVGLYIMNTRDMSGVGLPFAIGAKIGKPDKNVILITDKDSLLRQVQELQTTAGLGVGFSIICTDPGEGQALSRAQAILQGLGCETSRLEPGKSPERKKSTRPLAFMCV
ncbi:MAG: thiamine pyrophosphate-binding protein [bacterium]